jgi:hypothetical protein
VNRSFVGRELEFAKLKVLTRIDTPALVVIKGHPAWRRSFYRAAEPGPFSPDKIRLDD